MYTWSMFRNVLRSFPKILPLEAVTSPRHPPKPQRSVCFDFVLHLLAPPGAFPAVLPSGGCFLSQ